MVVFGFRSREWILWTLIAVFGLLERKSGILCALEVMLEQKEQIFLYLLSLLDCYNLKQ